VRRVRVNVSGRVQGVFYRATCARLARDKGLAGSVRNRPDGGVEAVFEGPRNEVEEMVAWCRRGPDLARVDEVVVSDEDPLGEADFLVTG
jgi:acylphosphatase